MSVIGVRVVRYRNSASWRAGVGLVGMPNFSNRLGQSERAHERFNSGGVVAGEPQIFVELTVIHIHR